MERTSRYISALNAQLSTRRAIEHSHRPALQTLLEEPLPGCQITKEPSRTAAGAPDYIIANAQSQAPIAYVEAKDIGDTDLHRRNQRREQFDQYKRAFGSLLFTGYLRSHLYGGETLLASATVGELKGQGIIARSEGLAKLEALAALLTPSTAQPARSAQELAPLMATKAQLLAQALRHTLTAAPQAAIQDQLQAFKKVLLHDVTPSEFADLYAQTITYGLFAARLQQSPGAPFSRQQAATIIPKTTPFLRKIFQLIGGYDLDPHLEWIVEAIAHLLAISNVSDLMDTPHRTRLREPMAHFYEDFLAVYDPHVSRARGVWYTPPPVVRFIVRAVDELLRTQFELPLGLADASRVGEHHRVQILDPAAGTGNFLTDVIKHIHTLLAHQASAWSDYVDRHLLPRLHGFELLVAPYTMDYLQIDLALRETGWKPDEHAASRIGIYLTNALDAQHPCANTLFAHWLHDEANRANRIKQHTPVMATIGNPPYSVSSRNKGEWIMNLLEEYKNKLNERNIQPLSDDYIKFIRLAQHYINRTGEGSVAFITNNSYLDGVIHRQIRHALRCAFNRIYVLNLHGNARRNATGSSAQKDENLFDIMTGVSFCFLVKVPSTPAGKLLPVFPYELRGSAVKKCVFLDEHTLGNAPWQELNPQEPYHFFTPKDFALQEEYQAGFRIDDLFVHYTNGIKTFMDPLNVQFTPEEAEAIRRDALGMEGEAFRSKYQTGPDKRDWSMARAQPDVRGNNDQLVITPYAYRPFDTRYMVYTGKTNGFVTRPRSHSLKFLRLSDNYSLAIVRQTPSSQQYTHAFIANCIPNSCYVSAKSGERGYVFPLYRHAASHHQKSDTLLRECDYSPSLYMHHNQLERVAHSLGEPQNPVELMDYIYATLHSPTYRTRYHKFLRIEFPRIPYPTNPNEYRRLAAIGKELRTLHLLENANEWNTGVTFPRQESYIVEVPKWNNNQVFINQTQHFGGMPHTAWEHQIGGYRPAKKRLKGRIGHTWTYGDMHRYAQIIHALSTALQPLC